MIIGLICYFALSIPATYIGAVLWDEVIKNDFPASHAAGETTGGLVAFSAITFFGWPVALPMALAFRYL